FELRPARMPFVDERKYSDRYGRFEPDHAERCGAPLAFLRLCGVGRMISSDDVDDTFGNCGAERSYVFVPTQRRIDFEASVVTSRKLLGEHEVVRGDFCGHLDASRLR